MCGYNDPSFGNQNKEDLILLIIYIILNIDYIKFSIISINNRIYVQYMYRKQVVLFMKRHNNINL